MRMWNINDLNSLIRPINAYWLIKNNLRLDSINIIMSSLKHQTLLLDNPVWNSLSEVHKEYALDYDGVKFFDPEYCPFGGLIKEDIASGLTEYASLVHSFFIVGDKPTVSEHIAIKKELICDQMILKKPFDLDIFEDIVALNSSGQKSDLSELVNLVQPGYFRIKTSELGQYFGIYKDGKLIAAGGERMKMNHFTEISAIVTHPNHTRRGYAKQIIKRLTDKILSEQKIAYLHVLESNLGAIKLYEKLGFTTRRKMSFWKLDLLTNEKSDMS